MSEHGNDQTTTWAYEREKATRLFGDASPSHQTDAEVAEVFARHPAAVVAEIAQLASAFDAGRVHSPWRALQAKLPKIVADSSPVNVGREDRFRLAEVWILNAGLYEPTEESLIGALFGEHGTLKAWANDQAMVARMVALWRAEKPRGEQAEAAMGERAGAWRVAWLEPVAEEPELEEEP